MKLRTILKLSFALAVLATTAAGYRLNVSQTTPNPVLVFVGSEITTTNGKEWTRYKYAVENAADLPKELFAPGANLPPCGKGEKASRGRVDIYDSRGTRLNEFCAVSKASDLGKLWFTLEAKAVPPSYVYIELLDTQTNTKYKSNLADTVQ